jgi:hypothetical protein
MQHASSRVLPGFPLRTDVKIIQHPERNLDADGKAMWNLVFNLLNQKTIMNVK